MSQLLRGFQIHALSPGIAPSTSHMCHSRPFLKSSMKLKDYSNRTKLATTLFASISSTQFLHLVLDYV